MAEMGTIISGKCNKLDKGMESTKMIAKED